MTSSALVAQRRRRQLAPLDERDRVLLDQLGQGQVGHLVQRARPVDVGVDEQPDRAALAAAVLAHQREGRAGHRARAPPGRPRSPGRRPSCRPRGRPPAGRRRRAGTAPPGGPPAPGSRRATRSSTRRASSRAIRRHEPLGPDEVGPHLGHGLAARPQHVGRVIGRDEAGPAPVEDLAAQLADALGGLEQELGGEVAQRDDDRGVDERDLLGQIRPARLDLLRAPGRGSAAAGT